MSLRNLIWERRYTPYHRFQIHHTWYMWEMWATSFADHHTINDHCQWSKPNMRTSYKDQGLKGNVQNQNQGSKSRTFLGQLWSFFLLKVSQNSFLTPDNAFSCCSRLLKMSFWTKKAKNGNHFSPLTYWIWHLFEVNITLGHLAFGIFGRSVISGSVGGGRFYLLKSLKSKQESRISWRQR